MSRVKKPEFKNSIPILWIAYAIIVIMLHSVSANAADSTVVASGTYYGYRYSSIDTSYSAYENGYSTQYQWTLYQDGLLRLTGCTNSSEDPGEAPGWQDYADRIVRIEIASPTGNSFSNFQVITKEMFSGYTNLKSIDAPSIRIIDTSAFRNCVNLQSVNIGYSSTELYSSSGTRRMKIHGSAFYNCTSLNEVSIGSADTPLAVNNSAFRYCSSLASVSLSAQKMCIGDYAFSGCTSLRGIDLSACTWGFTDGYSIGNSAFQGCTRLREVALPSTASYANYFGTAVFKNCPALQSISIPSGTTTLAANVFENCTSLTTATLPSTLTSIGSSAFAGCTSLSTCKLPAALTTIGSNAFQNCNSLTTANLGNSLNSIGANAYAGSGLTSVTVPAKVTTLTSSAFNDCDELKTVTLANGVKSLAANSFSNCDNLEKVTFSDSVITVAANAFANCPKLTELWFANETPTIANSSFAGVTATALYPLASTYWTESDMANYGGTLTWTPYGELSASKLTVDDAVYTGEPMEAVTHLKAANGMEVSPLLYSVAYYVDEACATQLDAAEVKNPGIYYVMVTGNGDMGCTGTTGPVAFEITKAPLTVSYTSETIDEGGEPAYAIAYEGFVADEDESVLTAPATLPAPSTLAPGHSYTLTPEGAEADNYEITYQSGTLTVNARSIDKPACVDGLVYTGSSQVAVEQGEGYTLSGTTRATAAGEYEATVSLQDGYIWSDGSSDDLTYRWSIEKAPLSATFVDETIDPGETPALKVNVTGFVNGESAGSAAGYEAPKATAPATMKPGYVYTARVSGGSATNYSFTYTSGKITVRAMAIDEPDVTRSFRYDGTEKQAIAQGEGYDLAGVWKATEAGSYRATATLADGYEWSDGTRDMKSYNWSISATAGSLVLDNTYLSLKIAEASTIGYTYTGDGEVKATSSDGDVATATVSASGVKVEAVGAGTAHITVSSTDCTNYTTPSAVTITVLVTSIDLSECGISATSGTYTGSQFDAKVTVTLPSGAELSELSSHALHYYDSAACNNEVAAADVRDAGTYWVRAEAVDGGRSSGRTQAALFVIEKAQLSAVYEGETIEYGAAPSAGVKVTGFVGGESASTAKGYVAPEIAFPEVLTRATSYRLMPSAGAATNYTFTYQGGTLTVKPQVVAVPTVVTGLVYNGSVHEGVVAGEGCLLSGDVTATDAGSYTANATLEEGCVWKDGTTETKSYNWEIARADMGQVEVSDLEDRDYTGAPITQNPTLTIDGYTLNSRDYSLSFADNRDAGTATVTVEGKGNFSGTKSLTFKIKALKLDESCVSGVAASYAYTGARIEPEPVVSCNGSTLEAGKDYEVSYADNLSAGTATLTVTGKGNYSGSAAVTFSIKQVSLKNAEIVGVVDTVFTGSAITQDAVVTLDGRTLVADEDYTVGYESNTNAGIAKMTFTGTGDISGSQTVRFVIVPASIESAVVTGIDPSYQYTGKAIRPVPQVELNGNELTEGKDYQLVYSDNISVGVANVVIEGLGNYEGSLEESFAITKASYDLSGVSFENDSVTYDGKAHSLSLSGMLPAGVSVAYDGNGAVTAGVHVVTATLTGDDNHEPIGAMTASLTIEKAQVEMPEAASGLMYTGVSQEGVKSGRLYTVTGGSGKDAGSYVSTVALNDADNYAWPDGTSGVKAVSWSIAKAQLRAAYVSEAVSYGETPELGVEVTGFVSDENASNAEGYAAPQVTSSAANAGSYRLVPSGGKAKNYAFEYVAGTLKINRAVVVVAAKPATKVYGSPDPTLEYEVFGADSGANIGSVSLRKAVGSDVGTYSITVTAPGTINYRIITIGSTFTITKASYDVSQLNFEDGEIVYDGASHFLSVSGRLPSGVSVWYENNNQVNAGSYRVVAHFVVDGNHNAIPEMRAILIIKPCSIADAKLTLDKRSFTYNGAVQKAGISLVGGNVIEKDSDYTAVYANELSRDAGTYSVKVVGVGNYTGESESASYTIVKAANPMTAVGKSPRVKLTKVKKAKQKIAVKKAITVTGAQGAVTYKKAKGKKGITVAKNGRITVKKGMRKGTYLVNVNVTAAGNANYAAKTVTVTVKVRVK